ncbi:PQQ-binding-like beta-propeller repeat protein [Dactylosporangium sp. NPDC000244]|uniref:outer membrane protein assembly factor BamB family protein n=1 Tax=Dactylosporangium sp. NPDC000244 TaxID=3154365 RepID=UPI00331F4F77
MLNAQTGGGRLVVGRFQPVGAGTQVEVRSLRDGARLWSRTLDVDQHLTFLTDDVMALQTDGRSGSADALTVLDAATGAQLWQRGQIAYFGQAGGRILAEDVAGAAGETGAVEVRPAGEDPANPEPEQRGRRYLALDEWTGATVWEVRVPVGSIADFRLTGGGHTGPAYMSQLSPAGVLQIRDLGTGRVVAEHRLDFSGAISSFRTGDPAVTEQVLIAKAGARGTDVYDRGTGRLLWHWQAERPSPWGADLFACAPGLYCLGDDSGLTALDARTGARRWHADGYNQVLGGDGAVLLVRPGRPGGDAAAPVVALDARTGRAARELAGWHFAGTVPGRGLVLWKSTGDRAAVLGLADPLGGRVTVFGRSASWDGRPECQWDRGMLACLADGVLAVWRLP